jgi:hypothetical protein
VRGTENQSLFFDFYVILFRHGKCESLAIRVTEQEQRLEGKESDCPLSTPLHRRLQPLFVESDWPLESCFAQQHK